MKLDTDNPSHALVRHGLDAYSQALATAGGKELQALMRPGSRAAVCAAIYASPAYALQVPPLPIARLSVNLTRSRVSGGIDGDKQRSFEAARYSMFFVPAGMPAVWQKDSPSRHLNIYFHADGLDGFDGTADGRVPFDEGQPLFNAHASGIGYFADQLAAELDGTGLFKDEAADSLARLILVRLARQLCGPGRAPNPLTPKLLASLRGYITAHLAERILVADLAREAGLPPNRFALAFSEFTRQSPHQFVLRMRLDRAAQLLRESSLNLVEVAHDCGFATQQHLCNTLRRHFGTTPSRYRRSHKPGTSLA